MSAFLKSCLADGGVAASSKMCSAVVALEPAGVVSVWAVLIAMVSTGTV